MEGPTFAMNTITRFISLCKLQIVYTCQMRRFEQHGLTGTKIHRIWCAMVSRCTYPSQTNFKHYGGRGISVCEEWKTSLLRFVADMGYPPSDQHTLDRLDTNGNYEPSNCHWATWSEQQKNRRPYKAKRKYGQLSLREMAEEQGVSHETVRQRLLNP